MDELLHGVLLAHLIDEEVVGDDLAIEFRFLIFNFQAIEELINHLDDIVFFGVLQRISICSWALYRSVGLRGDF